MVTITVNRTTCHVDASYDVIRKLDALLSYKDPNYYWISEVRESRWDGTYHLMTRKTNNFKLGLLYRVLYFLDVEDIPFQIADNRNLNTNFKFEYLDPERVLYTDDEGKEIKLRDAQIDSIKDYCKLRYAVQLGRGIFSMPPRSGKSLTAGVLSQVLNEYPVIFIVHKIDIAWQTKEVFEKLFKEKIGIVGDGNWDVEDCKVIVATVQSIDSAFDVKPTKKKKGETDDTKPDKEKDTGHYDEIKEFIKSARVILADECHVTNSATWQQVASYVRNVSYIAGFSGTPSRDQGDDLKVEQLCGAIIYHLSKETAVEKGYILPCIVYTVDLPELAISSGTYASQEKWGINNNEHILDAVEKIVKRLEKKNMSCVINVRKVEQGKKIQQRLGCEFLHGSVPRKKREEVYGKLQRKEILAIVSTVTDIGIDIPSLDAVILARVTMSKVASVQWVRCNTPHGDKIFGYVFLLCPRIKGVSRDYLRKHGSIMKNLYKEEPTFKVIEKRFEEL